MKGGDLEDRKGFLPKFQPYPLGVGGHQAGSSPAQHHFPGPPLNHPQHHAAGTPPPDEAEVDSRAMVLSSPPHPPQAAPDAAARKPKKGAAAGEGGGAGAGGDGATIEVVRRPRGRPPGSKNKPKPPVVITREAGDSTSVMRPHILEIPAGHDVVEALSRFSRRRDLGLSVLAATGPVSNVTLRQPQFHPAPISGSPPPPTSANTTTTLTFHGRFDILSVSATFFPPSFSGSSPMIPPTGGSFSISLAGPHGQIVGGCVAGPLVAAGTVTVVAAAFSGPTFHRLPADEELAVSVSVSPAPPPSGEGNNRVPPAAGSVDLDQAHHGRTSHPHQQHLHQQQQQQQRQMAQHHHHPAGSMAAGDHAAPMPISSSHLLSDVIWAPTARPPHHPSPYQ